LLETNKGLAHTKIEVRKKTDIPKTFEHIELPATKLLDYFLQSNKSNINLMMMIAFITFKSSLVPLFEGL